MTCLSLKRHVLRSSLWRISVLSVWLYAATATGQGISPSEVLLFETNHMQGIHTPTILTYSYRKEGASEGGFEDEVRVDVTQVNSDGTVTAATSFLSGDRNVPLPSVERAHGNPALLGFLERDIVEMKRLTGGSVNYFRKRIRLALADARELHPVRFHYAGKEMQGQEVRIQPYLNDPMRERFPQFERKSYTFLFSREVPGSLYRISSSSVEAAKSGQAAIVETLVLTRDKPAERK